MSDCLYCKKKLKLAPKYVRERGRAITADSLKPQFGYEGNNVFCSSRCGFLTAIHLIKSIPEIETLLPPKWNSKHKRSV